MARDLVPRGALVMLYLDPEGLELHFSTIQAFADAFDHLDLLVNFPVRGIVRYLTAGNSRVGVPVLDLTDTAGRIGEGGSWSDSVRSIMDDQLTQIGFNERTRREIRTDSKNSPLYELLLASRYPIAVELFEKANTIEPNGQRQIGFALGT